MLFLSGMILNPASVGVEGLAFPTGVWPGPSGPDIGGRGKRRETDMPHLEKTKDVSCFGGICTDAAVTSAHRTQLAVPSALGLCSDSEVPTGAGGTVGWSVLALRGVLHCQTCS